MKVKVKDGVPEITLGELKQGDVFRFERCLTIYLVVGCDVNGLIECVDIEKGVKKYFGNLSGVEIVNGAFVEE